MSMRFRKSKSIGKGLKLNVNKSSIGLTGGVKGAHVSVNSKGKTTKSAGISGTGISFRSSAEGASKGNGCMVTALKGLAVIIIAGLIILYAWIPAGIAGIIYYIYCRKTETELNKKYLIVGALIFAISLGAFVFNEVYKVPPQNNPAITSSMTSSSHS